MVCFAPTVRPGLYLRANVGLRGATHASACPVLHHPESNVGPQGLLVVRLPARSSHTPPVSASLRQSPPVWVPPRPRESSLPLLPIATPPTGLDVCFFFIYLVYDFLASSIFCQFWLCEEVQCVYLRRHLGSRYFI